MKQNQSKSYLYPILILLAVLLIYAFVPKGQTVKEVPLSEIAQDVADNKVDSITVKDTLITATLKDKTKIKATKEAGNATLKDYGITSDKVQINIQDTSNTQAFYSILSIMLPLFLIGGLIFFMMRSAQGANSKAMGFGKSGAKLFMGNTKITFNDVAGSVEPKQELFEIVEFLKNPKKFRDLGAEIPRGVLLVGPPGTGKTLLAKAVAGEAGVPFFSISASEFVEMFVGVGASRVRDLFLKAKRNAPAIIFIDELDAVGRQRGSGLGGSHDEREQTLNQILVEMDGFEPNDNVIVISATNRPDVLDPALLRPGRFDRQVMIDLPDKKERLDILKVHTKNKPLDIAVNLEKIAASTAGFSGADLRNLANEGAILAARGGKKTISQTTMDEAIEKVMMGPERRSRVLSEKEKHITAIHEAGHAVVGHILPNADPIHKISVVSRGMTLGFTWNMPSEERRLETKSRFLDRIASLMGGRVAEEEFFGRDNITTGAQNDLKVATQLARKMVTEYGMSEKLGPQTYGHKDELPFLGKEFTEQRNYSDKIANLIDEEVSRLIKEGRDTAKTIVDKNKAVITKISDTLLKKETIEEAEFLTFFPKHKAKTKA